jgi:hypothetical protein
MLVKILIVETEKRMDISDDCVSLKVVTLKMKVEKECCFLHFHDGVSTFRALWHRMRNYNETNIEDVVAYLNVPSQCYPVMPSKSFLYGI